MMRRMKSFAMLFVALMVAFASCQKVEPVAPAEPETPGGETPAEGTVIFTATTESPSTKAELSDNGDDTFNVVWTVGDAINVNGINLTLQTEDQPAGYGPGYTRGNFSGSWAPTPSGTSPKYKVVTPSSIFGTPGSLPTEQTYVAGNIAAIPMYAESDTQSLSFHNLCGIVRIGLKGDTRSISSITLVDVDDTPKPLSGPYTVTSGKAVITSGSAGTSLVCSPAVALSMDEYTYFSLNVPVASYGRLKIMIEATDGAIWTLTSNKSIVVERSEITTINLSSPNFRNDKAVITYTTYNGSKIDTYAGGADASVFGEGLTVISHTYADGVGTITLSGTITQIGNSAFNGKSAIVTMTIPETVTSIGGSAFRSMSRLTTLNIPEGVTSVGDMAFQGCTAFNPAGQLSHITSFGGSSFNNTLLDGALVLSDAVTKVDNYAFRGTRISSVTFEGTPATLGNYIFMDCGSLTSATFEADIHIPLETFNGCGSLESVTFGGACTSIGNNAFLNCSSLASIVLPSSLTALGTYSFKGCTLLSSVTLSTNPSFTTIPSNCFEGCSLLTTLSIPSNITNIGAAAFQNCGFTSLPEGWGRSGITYGSGAFKGCPISSITFPDGWTTIPNYFCDGITSLEEINLGSGITSIGAYAFRGCTSLADVTLSSVLSTIGNNAFSGCSSLKSLSLPASLININNYAFENCGFIFMPVGWQNTGITYGGWVFKGCPITSITFPNTWTSIPAGFCRDMTALETVVINSGVTEIGGNAFTHCTSLSSVTIPEGVTTLSQYAFYECSSLSTVSLPSTVTTIGQNAFQKSGLTALPAGLRGDVSLGTSVFHTTKISSISLPDGMTSIPAGTFSACTYLTYADLNDVTTVACAFSGCSALATVTGPEVLTLDDGAFENCSSLSSVNIPKATTIGGNCFISCTSLETISLPSATWLKGGAFSRCTSLASVSLPQVRTLGNQVFNGCSALTSASLPSVETMGHSVFYDCVYLVSVDLGSGLTSMDTNCFRNNIRLTSLTVRATSVPTLTTTLSNYGSFTPTIYVPASSVGDYKGASVWSNYASSITAITE